MAEILLSLTIIGVVAAITLPSLTGNINERTWNTQRKALYARISQAIALMPALNGYGTLDDTTDTAAETFVTAGLSKVLKINNICDNEHLGDCGMVSSYTNLAASGKSLPQTLFQLNSCFESAPASTVGESWEGLDTKAAAFETQNGESIALYYNPNCVGNMQEKVSHWTQPKMCANFIYDLNGNKGPNTVGKDIGFITVFYPTDSIVVAPLPLTHNASSSIQYNDINKYCLNQDSESRVPNINELTSLFYNQDLVGIYSGDYWSSSVISATEVWSQRFYLGSRYNAPRTHSGLNLRCVKR